MDELFASTLHLDRVAIKALKIKDPYSLHRVVYSLFSDIRSDVEKQSHIRSGILYADKGGDFHGRKALIVSNRVPMERIEDRYGEVVSKPIAASFLGHSRYRFNVQVNPVRKDTQSEKRVAVKGRADIASWFIQRAERSWGFTVDLQTLQINAVEVLQFSKSKEEGGPQITISRAHVQGQLDVTDLQQFQNSFKNGIGKGRAFGCGLLEIVPIIDKKIT